MNARVLLRPSQSISGSCWRYAYDRNNGRRSGGFPLLAANRLHTSATERQAKASIKQGHIQHLGDAEVIFSWAQGRRFVTSDPMAAVPRPKFQDKPVEPLTRQEIERILQACKYSAVAQTNGRRPFKMQRPTYRQDKALTMFLLDTGLRASELCALRVGDVDMKTGEVTVRHGKEGGAKGDKGRTVYSGKGTRRTLWRYLVEREDGENDQAPLFATMNGGRMNRDSLRLLYPRLGEQAEVKKCHPHRFRHTFAQRIYAILFSAVPDGTFVWSF